MSNSRPNILFIMSDDHAAHAMSCYGSRINQTPHLDRIANEGMRFDNCFCTNSICTPSRAAIITGTYNHINGCTTLSTHWDNSQACFPKLLQDSGYQTAMIGKWHLGQGEKHWPTGFDYWSILPGQGLYHDPVFVEIEHEKNISGYVTDITTDKSIDWIKSRDKSRPFMLMCHHKAPHRPWEPDEKHADMYKDVEIPYPATFDDDYKNRSSAAEAARMRIDLDLNDIDLKQAIPEGLSQEEEKKWKYQRYIKDYLRCVASIDDNVGRLLDFLDDENLTENTIIVYTSDQGFFLGDHGWYDKRFMYEESLRMPFIIRYPREIEPGTSCEDMILNVDFAETFLDYAGIKIPELMQGKSFRTLLEGHTPGDWRTSMYYRYWAHQNTEVLAEDRNKGHGGHNVYAHYGLRTHDYKLIYYYGDALGQAGTDGEKAEPEWELFDLRKDPCEINSVYDDPAYAPIIMMLKDELHRLQAEVDDKPYDLDI